MRRRRVPLPVAPLTLGTPLPLDRRPSRYTKEQRRDQYATVEAALIGMVPATQIAKALRDRWGVSTKRAKAIMVKVRARWAAEDAERRPHWKEQQVRSLERSIHQLEVYIGRAIDEDAKLRQQGQAGRPPPQWLYHEKREYMRVLSALTGTQEAQQVNVSVVADVTVHEKVMVTIAQMTAADMAEAIAQMGEQERMADEWKREHALLPEGNAQ